MPGKLPAILLYVADYLKDTRGLTCEQKGFYVDLLCYMHESPRWGHLMQPSGKPFTNERLGLMTGTSADSASRLLQELIDAAVISVSADGVPFSRRMVKDEQKRQKCATAGKLGGNPALKGQVKGLSKGLVNHSLEDEDLLKKGGKEEGGLGEGEREELRGGLLKVFRLKPVTEEEFQDLDAMVSVLTLKGAMLTDLYARVGRYRKAWPTMPLTPRALFKWWDHFAPEEAAPKGESPDLLAMKKAREAEEASWLAMDADEQERLLQASQDTIRNLARGRI